MGVCITPISGVSHVAVYSIAISTVHPTIHGSTYYGPPLHCIIHSGCMHLGTHHTCHSGVGMYPSRCVSSSSGIPRGCIHAMLLLCIRMYSGSATCHHGCSASSLRMYIYMMVAHWWMGGLLLPHYGCIHLLSYICSSTSSSCSSMGCMDMGRCTLVYSVCSYIL
jgi:hypothetical protein